MIGGARGPGKLSGAEVRLGVASTQALMPQRESTEGRGSPKERGWRKNVRKLVWRWQQAEGLRNREEAGQLGFRRGSVGPGKALWMDTVRPMHCPHQLGVIYPLTQDNPLSSPVQEMCTLQMKTFVISKRGKAPSSSAGR